MIGKRVQNLKKMTIRKQIFLALVLVTVAVTLSLGVVLYQVSRRTIEDDYRQAHADSLQVASNILAINLQSDVDEERNLLTNSTFTAAFSGGGAGTSFPASSNQTLTKQLNRVLFSRSEIRDILAVNTEGNILFTSQNDYNQKYVIPYYDGTQDLLSMDWIADCDAAKGKEIFYSGNVLFDDGKNDVFSVAKKLISIRNRAPLGYVVFNIRTSSLAAAFASRSGSYGTSDYCILDDSGSIVYAAEEPSADALAEIQDKLSGQMPEKEGNYVVAGFTNPLTQWNIVHVIARRELAGRSRVIGLAAFLTASALILASVWISSLISRHITAPLGRLEQTMKEVAGGKYEVREVFDDSEVGRIGNRFKDLVNNNIELESRLLRARIQERESQLLLLQTQINPHYLYNTLDTLYFMAVIRGEDQIADFVQALSENFKLSLNQGDELIPVSDELRRIRAYMKIQNYRFENRYTLVIRVPEEMNGEYLLTFLLQPLVENSVYHGLEPKPGPGTIWIAGSRENGILTFTVDDDGIGIQDAKALDAGYGVRNIRERIRLFYGESYGIAFSARKEGGTRAVMTSPVLTKEQVEKTLRQNPDTPGGQAVPDGQRIPDKQNMPNAGHGMKTVE